MIRSDSVRSLGEKTMVEYLYIKRQRTICPLCTLKWSIQIKQHLDEMHEDLGPKVGRVSFYKHKTCFTIPCWYDCFDITHIRQLVKRHRINIHLTPQTGTYLQSTQMEDQWGESTKWHIWTHSSPYRSCWAVCLHSLLNLNSGWDFDTGLDHESWISAYFHLMETVPKLKISLT